MPKLTLPPFKSLPLMDQNAAQATWEKLDRAIDEIYNRNSSSLRYEEVYRYCYNLVLQKKSDFLYQSIKEAISRHLNKSVEIITNSSSDVLLQTVVTEWNKHLLSFDLIQKVCLYMDSNYCKQRHKPTVFVLSLQLFRDLVLFQDSIRNQACQKLLDLIKRERIGFVIDRDLVKEFLSMMVSLSRGCEDSIKVYEDEFEVHFFQETEKFYRSEAQLYLSSNSCLEYIQRVEDRLSQESVRLNNYLSSSSELGLKTILYTQLIVQNATVLMEMANSGVKYMVENQKLEDIKKLYSLFSLVGSTLDLLRDFVGKLIVENGDLILGDPENGKDSISFVRHIFDLKDKYDQIIESSMNGDKKMHKKLKDSFEEFINRDNRCASYLAGFVDELIKNRLQGLSESEIETKVEKIIIIFRYITDKDIFESYYKNLLSKRLINSKLLSDEVDRTLIAKLKAECGYQFTSKLEGMLLDIKMSENINSDYRHSVEFTKNSHDMDILLLTVGYWPFQTSSSINLPPEIQLSCSHFLQFYSERNSGRKISWLTNLGSIDLKANFPEGRKEFNVTVYQATMLLLFNRKESYSLDEIRQVTNIPEIELKRHLLSLCTPKLKLLLKASKGKVI